MRNVMPWHCSCGRYFRSSRKCLKCGDSYPRWVEEGKMTPMKRASMTTIDYRTWMERQIEEENEVPQEAIQEALYDLIRWTRSG